MKFLNIHIRVRTTGYLRLACALPIASSNKSLQAKYALPFALPVKKNVRTRLKLPKLVPWISNGLLWTPWISNQYLIFLGDRDHEVTEGSEGPFVTFVEKKISVQNFSASCNKTPNFSSKVKNFLPKLKDVFP